MKTAQEIRSILASHREELRARFGVKEIGIFGSSARGDAGAKSDIDIVVDFEKPIGLEFTELADYLESLLSSKVDVVSKRGIKPRFLPSVEQDLIYV
ncbi:MAG: nucleotidyltransferase family protein [Ignavibacteriae bacterium]|nr:nucleotidyltransferase family protein [Ignavibacteriota bacterium]